MHFHLLPAQYQNAAFERRAKLTKDAQKLDSSTWSQLQPDADIFDYLERKIVGNLNGLQNCVPAGRAWRMHLNHAQLRRGMMWSTGTSRHPRAHIMMAVLNFTQIGGQSYSWFLKAAAFWFHSTARRWPGISQGLGIATLAESTKLLDPKACTVHQGTSPLPHCWTMVVHRFPL